MTMTEESKIAPLETVRYQMVALDMDGTLLQSNHQLADVQASYLRELHQRGLTVCIATGRAAPSVYETVQKINLPEPIPVVCSNGARGLRINAQTMEKEELFYNPVSRETVLATLKLAQEHDYAIQYYYEDSIYVNSSKAEHLRITKLYTKLTGSPVLSVDDQFQSMLDQDQLPSKLLVLFDEPQLEQAYKLYTTQLSSTATIVLGGFDWFLEILNPLVHKGHGLANLCRHLNVSLDACVAMGDGANDVEFLQMAGLGLAMKNAKDAAQQHADATLEWNNDEHGVMKALQRLDSQGMLNIASG